jgi:hypothetical protein
MVGRIIRQEQEMRTQADGMVEMHEKSIGKNNNCAKLLDESNQRTMRCDGKLRIIPLSPVLPHLLVLMLQMTREALRVELVYRRRRRHHHHLSAAAEREDEMEDGACCNVELACGLVVWPVRVCTCK